jgi:poly(A) polymerase
MPQLFKVGGCVRDRMLGLNSKDIDFTFVPDDQTVSVEEGFKIMVQWLTDHSFEIFLSTPECFTIRAKFPKNHKNAGLVADFVMARKEEGYTDNSRKPILVLGSLEDDLIRRDFTVNAMAESEDGSIIDIFNGERDLVNKILRTPLDPNKTMLDDPLRFLRALRFAITKDFSIHSSIFEAVENNPQILEKLKTTVSKERIRAEIFLMMKANTVKSLHLLSTVEARLPGFTELVFDEGLWLKPTFEV